MYEHYTGLVIPTLAQHLGVQAREIAPAHDLYRDWGLTPLALIVILLDLERIVAIELPPEELGGVRTVGHLIAKFSAWMRRATPDPRSLARRRARRSRHAQRERRIRRELHFLRWLEQNEARRTQRAAERSAQ
ncbi:MAG TPA: acyl carrier protein [Polyangiaceae bacterium]|jgi:acyl carrier protein|nr:acyl carrier protein [Polyangiaceae bacterium]